MSITIKNLTKDLKSVDLNDLLSSWRWLVQNPKQVIIVSTLGDLFTIENDNSIHWLQTDLGTYSKVAENLEEFYDMLGYEENIDNWFLPLLNEKLITAKKPLKANEIYSCIKPTILGGVLSPENIHVVNMSVHFAFTGALHEQIKDLPDGTAVNIKFTQ
ncbi:MAG: DUF1851 domain-containing protein [Bacteroidia bacterium]|nr:DUF1851 domain-containing protein [Bacteroidia bacterium]